MSSSEKLQATLNALNTQRAKIIGEGWFLQHCWLVQVKPGGTAHTDSKYWQVRSRQPLFNGKTLKHLRAEEVEDYKAAIARGRQITQVDRQIKKLQQQLSQQASTADVSGDVSILSRSTPQETSLPVPMLVGSSQRSPKESVEQPLVKFADLAEQECLVKEVLASSQALRASLRQSVALCKQLGARNTDLRKGHPRA
ncbi:MULTISPECIES: hypothetical protein [unclassified Leptolyngbya]|uniref:hypothetical protein n=1 Tax=unclassified Leptolyngbya TaxID=2650499 RepID=UPI001686BA5F|nr:MULTISPECIES: hypothetical protein [unclassified Leptolyngbya]MBD1913227.1 hypothetical protein [Leptolyngbya sp. FACHB-8]MBD2153383.1 hypothetical protein [Leptolyngbya sp. FACHB-16]